VPFQHRSCFKMPTDSTRRLLLPGQARGRGQARLTSTKPVGDGQGAKSEEERGMQTKAQTTATEKNALHLHVLPLMHEKAEKLVAEAVAHSSLEAERRRVTMQYPL